MPIDWIRHSPREIEGDAMLIRSAVAYKREEISDNVGEILWEEKRLASWLFTM